MSGRSAASCCTTRTSARQTALDLKAPLASPTFTGTPAAPTASAGTNTTQLATTAFVKAAIDVVLGGVSSAFDTLSEIATAIGGKLTASSNLSDLGNAGTARTNLGLGDSATKNTGTTTGTVAAGDDSRITGAAQKSSNLSDLGSAATARTNLGLGDAATKNTGTTTGTVAAGDDSRIAGAAQKSSNLSDLGSAAAAFGNIKQDATTSATGVVELATVAEAGTGTDTTRAVTAAGLFPAQANVASAATCNIGAAASSTVSITGTTTITAFDNVAAGLYRRGTFAGALTLTHNGTSLKLPGAANIATAANDRFGALSLGSGNWIVLWYQKADGTAVASGGGGLAAATQAEMEAATSITVGVTPGRQHFHPGHPKVWAKVNGAGTSLLASYNVSGITDTGTGRLTITVDDDFSSSDWACIASTRTGDTSSPYGVGFSGEIVTFESMAAGSVVLQSADLSGAFGDPSDYSMAGFGDN